MATADPPPLAPLAKLPGDTAPLATLLDAWAAGPGATRSGAAGLWLLRVGAVGLCGASVLSMAAMNIAFAVMVVGAVVARLPWHRLPLVRFGVLFAALQMLSISVAALAGPTADGITVPLRPTGMTYLWLIAPLTAVALADATWRRRALIALAVSLVVAATVAAGQFFIGYDDGSKPLRIGPDGPRFDRVSGVFGVALTLGHQAMVAGLAFAGAVALPPALAWAARVGALFALVASSARGPFLGLCAGVVAILSLRRGRVRAWGLGALAVVAVLMVGLLFVLRPAKMQRLVSNPLAGDPRVQIWQTSIAVAAERPWLGVGGPEAFPAAYRRLYPTVVDKTRPDWDPTSEFPPNGAPHAHNSVLSIACENGVPTALAWVLFLGAAGWLCLRARHRHPQAAGLGLGAIAAHLGAGMFEHFAGDSESVIGFHLILGLALAQVLARDGVATAAASPAAAAPAVTPPEPAAA